MQKWEVLSIIEPLIIFHKQEEVQVEEKEL